MKYRSYSTNNVKKQIVESNFFIKIWNYSSLEMDGDLSL